MNPHPSAPPARAAIWREQLHALRQQTVAWWKERTTRERILLKFGSSLLALYLIWTLGLQPALDTVAQSRVILPRLRAEAAQVDSLILEARTLQHAKSGQIPAADLSDALRASLRRAGLQETTSLNDTGVQPDDASWQWEVVFANASAEHTMQWLAGLAAQLQLQTHHAHLVRANVEGRDRPGYVSGRVVVRQPAKQAP